MYNLYLSFLLMIYRVPIPPRPITIQRSPLVIDFSQSQPSKFHSHAFSHQGPRLNLPNMVMRVEAGN